MPNFDQDPLDGALEHLQRLPRATPPPALLGKIEAELLATSAKVIPLGEWRQLVAAALFILSLNVTALVYYSNNLTTETATAGYAENNLISDYQLYE